MNLEHTVCFIGIIVNLGGFVAVSRQIRMQAQATRGETCTSP